MLSLRRRVGQFLVGVLVAGFVVFVAPSPARADYIYCPPDNGPCILIADGGGGAGGGGGGAGGGGGSSSDQCLHEQLGWISCHKAGLGWFNPTDSCFYDRLDLAINDPAWNGHDPSAGDMYSVWCWGGLAAGWELVAIRYLTSSPPGYGGLPSAVSIALRAINQLDLRAPVIQTAPKPPSQGGVGLVGLPVWMWTSAPRTWGTYSATASVPGVSVRATGRATKITWKMGNGATVTCFNRGTAYDPSFGTRRPPCGYNGYPKPGVFTITATTTWVVDWTGGGDSGTVTLLRSSTSTVNIDEMQVVNK